MERARTYQAAGMTLAISAGVAVIANALHPRFDTAVYDDPVAYVAEIDSSAIWLVNHLVIMAAIIGIVFGIVALAFHLTEEDRARPWAFAAIVAALVSGSAAMVTIAVDGLVMPAFAATLGAPEGAAALTAVDLGMFASVGLLSFGLVPMILGMALVRSDAYPHWTGFVALAAGVLGIVTGVIIAVQASIPTVATVTFLLASIPWTLTQVVLGSQLRKHAIEDIAGHVPGATPA